MAISGDFTWPSEAIDMLRRYWDAGASGSYIAGRINATFKCALSRNAVMGKIDRLGLKRSPQQVRQTQQQSARRTAAIVRVERKAPVLHGKLAARVKVEGEAPPKPSSSRNSRFFLPQAPRPAVVEAPPEPPAPPPVPEAQAAPITILELTATSCRWPVDPVGEHGWRFCGKTRACSAQRHPYCAEHRERSIGRIYRRGAA